MTTLCRPFKNSSPSATGNERYSMPRSITAWASGLVFPDDVTDDDEVWLPIEILRSVALHDLDAPARQGVRHRRVDVLVARRAPRTRPL